MTDRHVYVLAAILAIAGGAIFFYKSAVLGIPTAPGARSTTWTIEAAIDIASDGGPMKVSLQTPVNPPGYRVLEENFISRGFGLAVKDEAGGGRIAEWAIRRTRGKQSLYYRAEVFHEEGEPSSGAQPPYPPTPQLEEPYQTALQELVDETRAHSADIESFTSEMLRKINDPSPGPYVDFFLARGASAKDKADLAVLLLAGAHIPARMAQGVFLSENQRNANIVPWLEVHNEQRWLYFDPATGSQGLPDNLFLWWRGGDPLVTVDGGENLQYKLAVNDNQVDTMDVAASRVRQRKSRALEYSPASLPINTQMVYRILLLVPLGALVVVIMRNLVGVRTFGTFMPVLIALAFRETQLLGGIILFTLIVTMGLAIRFYLEKLKLLMVPRLASVLAVVVLLMLAISIIGHRLGLDTGLSVALFPMVILTMVIERMSTLWEERGPQEALIDGAGSLIVAALAFLVMSIQRVEYLTFFFPELLLLILAVTLLMGRYTGYRLLELRRFKVLANDK